MKPEALLLHHPEVAEETVRVVGVVTVEEATELPTASISILLIVVNHS